MFSFILEFTPHLFLLDKGKFIMKLEASKQASKQAKSDLNSTSQSKQIILQEINKVKEKRTILEKIIRLFTKHKRITAKQNKQKFIVPFK